MRLSQKKSGFSLVELMLVAIATSIMVLIFGSIMYFSFKGWHQNAAAVELQRTAYVAMRTIATEIRHSDPISTTNVTATSIYLGKDTRDPYNVTNRVFLIEDGALKFSRNGNPGATLISSELLEPTNPFFEVINTNSPSIQINLELRDESAASSINTRYIISERN
jgi:type II secretory pathway pseudopilin PulG